MIEFIGICDECATCALVREARTYKEAWKILNDNGWSVTPKPSNVRHERMYYTRCPDCRGKILHRNSSDEVLQK